MNAITNIPHRGWGLFNDFDHVLNAFFAPVRSFADTEQRFVPALDIVENEDAYTLKTDLPGISKEHLKVSVKDAVLSIDAEMVSQEAVKEGGKVIKRERRTGRYHRTLSLGNNIDETQIKAEYADGVLTLTLPKAQQPVAREIEVAVH